MYNSFILKVTLPDGAVAWQRSVEPYCEISLESGWKSPGGAEKCRCKIGILNMQVSVLRLESAMHIKLLHSLIQNRIKKVYYRPYLS
jgi:hypothetical protein